MKGISRVYEGDFLRHASCWLAVCESVGIGVRVFGLCQVVKIAPAALLLVAIFAADRATRRVGREKMGRRMEAHETRAAQARMRARPQPHRARRLRGTEGGRGPARAPGWRPAARPVVPRGRRGRTTFLIVGRSPRAVRL